MSTIIHSLVLSFRCKANTFCVDNADGEVQLDGDYNHYIHMCSGQLGGIVMVELPLTFLKENGSNFDGKPILDLNF